MGDTLSFVTDRPIAPAVQNDTIAFVSRDNQTHKLEWDIRTFILLEMN